MKTMRDPEGRELRLVYFEYVGMDDVGSFTLRIRSEEDTMTMPDKAEALRSKFLQAWVPLTEEQQRDLKKDPKASLSQALVNAPYLEASSLRKTIVALEEDLVVKTEELRKLQRERDPERFAFSVAEAVKTRTSSLEAQVQRTSAEKHLLQQEIEELRASKKRLKEANERLKGRG